MRESSALTWMAPTESSSGMLKQAMPLFSLLMTEDGWSICLVGREFKCVTDAYLDVLALRAVAASRPLHMRRALTVPCIGGECAMCGMI